jgi:hypothetical protein
MIATQEFVDDLAIVRPSKGFPALKDSLVGMTEDLVIEIAKTEQLLDKIE